MGLWDRLTKSPEDQLIKLIADNLGSPGFSHSYDPHHKRYAVSLQGNEAEKFRPEVTRLFRSIDPDTEVKPDLAQTGTIFYIRMNGVEVPPLVERINEVLEGLPKKKKYELSLEAVAPEHAIITSWKTFLEGNTEKLLADFDMANKLLLLRVRTGEKPLKPAEVTFLMKYGEIVALDEGAGILIRGNGAVLDSYVRSLSDNGLPVVNSDVREMIPALRKTEDEGRHAGQVKKKLEPDYIATLRDQKRTSPLSWSRLKAKPGEEGRSVTFVFLNEDLRDAFIGTLPPGVRQMQPGVPDDMKAQLVSKGVASPEDCCMLHVMNADVAQAIDQNFPRGQAPTAK